MLKRHLTLILKVDNLSRFSRHVQTAPKNGGTATIANNVLMESAECRARIARQRAVFGSFGRNTASSPIAGRKAQT